MLERVTITAPDRSEACQFTLPTTWSDVTLGQYLALVALDSPSVDSIMTGLSGEKLGTLPEADRAEILQRLLFLTDTDVLQELMATPGLYEIGHCSFGLFDRAHKYFAANPNLMRLEQGAYLYALYRSPVSPSPSPEHVATAHAAVLAAPVTEVYADCRFFLASWERQINGTTPPGPYQPGLSYLTDANGKRLTSAGPPAPAPSSWRSKLGNLWNPTKRAVA